MRPAITRDPRPVYPAEGWSCLTCKRGFAGIFCRCPYCMHPSKEPGK